jgi:hypothetical protein
MLRRAMFDMFFQHPYGGKIHPIGDGNSDFLSCRLEAEESRLLRSKREHACCHVAVVSIAVTANRSENDGIVRGIGGFGWRLHLAISPVVHAAL